MKALVSKGVKAVAVVIHDPKVERAAWSFAALVAVRLLIAAGASAELVSLVQKILG